MGVMPGWRYSFGATGSTALHFAALTDTNNFAAYVRQSPANPASLGSYSFCCWARATALTDLDNWIFAMWNVGDTDRLLIRWGSGLSVRLENNAQAITNQFLATSSLNTWYWFGFTQNGTTWKQYVATMGDADATSLTSVTGFNLSTVSKTIIGGNSNFGYGAFNGDICYARLWNGVLSDAQMLAEFKASAAEAKGGLIGDWPLNSTSTVGLDNSGNSNTLTDAYAVPVNPWTTTTGPTLSAKTQQALTITTSTDRLTSPVIPTSLTNYTWCAWLNLTAATATYAVANYFNVSGLDSETITTNPATNVLSFYDAAFTPTTLVTMAANTWYFVGYTHNGTTVNWYVAQEGASSLTTGTITSVAAPGAVNNLQACGENGFPWNGKISRMRMWNAVLTATEMLNEFKSNTYSRGTNILVDWPLDSTTTPGVDESGNGNTATGNGSTGTLATGPVI